MTFDEWWKEQPTRFTAASYKEDAREIWNAAIAAANERIRELEASPLSEEALDILRSENNRLKTSLASEREVSDKLAEALMELQGYNPRMVYRGGLDNGSYTPAGGTLLKVLNQCGAALAEVSRIRAVGNKSLTA